MKALHKRWIVLSLLALTLVAMPRCGGGEETGQAYEPAAEASGEASLVERAATIALEIEADPDATEQILERHGVTAEEFEEMMLEISKDEQLRKEYNARLGG